MQCIPEFQSAKYLRNGQKLLTAEQGKIKLKEYLKVTRNESESQNHKINEMHTLCFPSAVMTLKGCQSGSLRYSSHNEHNSEALSSASSSLYFRFITSRKGLLSSSPILLRPIWARPDNSFKAYEKSRSASSQARETCREG